MSDYFVCPQCGAEVKIGAKSCPDCGSDDQTGWNEYNYMNGIDIPDEDEYNELKENEFSEKKKLGNHWIIITGSILLVGILIMVLKGMF